ncbi:MAG TPA: hypothetical protein VF763_14160 [Candidatus Limnocylindrales bacterium]
MAQADRLRHASDALLAALEQLAALEHEKRTLTPGSDPFVELATRIDLLARQILEQSGRERHLAEATAEQRRSGAPPERPIEATPAAPDAGSRAIHDVLADWRDAERRLADAPPGSPEARALEARIDALREEYRVAHEAARDRSE